MERLGPDNQGGFNWTVTFTSDNQDGDLPLMTVETDAVTGTETEIQVYSVEDGSYLDGFVNVTFGGNSSQVAANATAEEMRVALEAVGTGSLGVSHEGIDRCVDCSPTPSLGYTSSSLALTCFKCQTKRSQKPFFPCIQERFQLVGA